MGEWDLHFYLGSGKDPIIQDHKRAIWKGSHNPRSCRRKRSPWLLTTEPFRPGSPSSKWWLLEILPAAKKLDLPHTQLGGGFKYFLFSPWSLEKWSKLTNIFQMGWFNHQLDKNHGENQPPLTEQTDPWLPDGMQADVHPLRCGRDEICRENLSW